MGCRIMSMVGMKLFLRKVKRSLNQERLTLLGTAKEEKEYKERSDEL